MQLNNRQKRFLKGKAHALAPAVTVGNRGLAESVKSEIEGALARHELIKVKIPAGAKADRQALAGQISADVDAKVIALTGRIVILFRISNKKNKSLETQLKGLG